jgi:hypothetical protein
MQRQSGSIPVAQTSEGSTKRLGALDPTTTPVLLVGDPFSTSTILNLIVQLTRQATRSAPSQVKMSTPNDNLKKQPSRSVSLLTKE